MAFPADWHRQWTLWLLVIGLSGDVFGRSWPINVSLSLSLPSKPNQIKWCMNPVKGKARWCVFQAVGRVAFYNFWRYKHLTLYATTTAATKLLVSCVVNQQPALAKVSDLLLTNKPYQSAVVIGSRALRQRNKTLLSPIELLQTYGKI